MADDEENFCDPQRLKRVLWPYRLCVSFCALCLLSLISVAIANAVLESPWPDANNFRRCETVIKDQLLREPWNAVSNFGYIWAGFYMMMASTWDIVMYQKLMRVYREKGSEEDINGPQMYNVSDFSMIGLSLGVSMALVGVSSFRYHACGGRCELGGFYDVYAIYVTVCYLLLAAILFFICVTKCILPHAGDKVRVLAINVLYLIAFVVCAIVWLDYRALIQDPLGGIDNTKFLMIGLFAFLVVLFTSSVIIARCRKLTPNYDKQTLPILAFFLTTGLVSWAPEELFEDCSPVAGDFFFQLHAYWHVALSIAVLCAYMYLRSLSNKTIQLHGGYRAHICLKEIGDLDKLEIIPGDAEEKPEL